MITKTSPLHHHKVRLLSIFFCFLFISSILTNAEEGDVLVPPKTESDLTAILPIRIRHLNMTNPKVDFKIRISSTGEMTDFVPISATHVDLVKRASKMLQDVVFSPATRNGKPIPSNIEISISFYDPVIATGTYTNEESGLDHIEDALFSMTRSQYQYVISSANDLDNPLQIIERKETAAPYDEDGNMIQGTAVIEFYIDPEGVPRLPTVKTSDHIEISKAAVYTVQQMRFSEPKRNQNPTTVKAQLPISYK